MLKVLDDNADNDNIFIYTHHIGGYHFEIDDGRVRWFHRNHEEQPVFSVVTNDVISPNTWYHLVGTYSSKDGTAKVKVPLYFFSFIHSMTSFS